MKYFEDLPAGTVIELGSIGVSQDEIIDFARKYDPQYFHVDPVAAQDSIFGGLVASGWHTCALFMNRLANGLLLNSSSLGSPGMDEIRWLLPLRPGDTLDFTATVESAAPSRSKPDRGVCTMAYHGVNQNGETVIVLRGKSMFGRRPA